MQGEGSWEGVYNEFVRLPGGGEIGGLLLACSAAELLGVPTQSQR